MPTNIYLKNTPARELLVYPNPCYRASRQAKLERAFLRTLAVGSPEE